MHTPMYTNVINNKRVKGSIDNTSIIITFVTQQFIADRNSEKLQTYSLNSQFSFSCQIG